MTNNRYAQGYTLKYLSLVCPLEADIDFNSIKGVDFHYLKQYIFKISKSFKSSGNLFCLNF